MPTDEPASQTAALSTPADDPNDQAQKQFPSTLDEKHQINTELAAAVIELDRRLQNLLSSRLLHFGWKIGLGRTPYWNDPADDELTDLIDRARLIAGDPTRVWQRPFPAEPSDAMNAALAHLHRRGFAPKVILDIGAARGYWSVNTACLWPEAHFFMIDPLTESEPHLQKICQDSRFHYLPVAVGDRPGEIAMHVAADTDSSSILLADNTNPASHRMVPICTVDQLLDSGRIKPAELIKLDVQGYELHVLAGAAKLFDPAAVFIIEANLFQFMPGCPRLHELIAFMAARGFYSFDFAGFLRRPFGNDLGQVDVVFVHHRNSLVASNRWNDSPGAQPPPGDSTGAAVAPIVSVIVCTKDPEPRIISQTLDALDRQTFSRERFETVIVDNASAQPLDLKELTEGRSLKIRLIREPVPGLGRARCAGIANTTAQLLVFVDDDNFLAPDYLQKAISIADAEPRIGLFGGIAEAKLESPIANWKRPALAHLGVRNHGDKPITRFADRWGEWEPIGAGMVARRTVAERFVRMFHEIPEARILGRSGSNLLSGEDSLFARAAFREGFACSYQPSLRLTHFIKSSRLTARYLGRVIEGHGRSFVLLQRALRKPVKPLRWRTAIARMLYRLKDVGRAGFITGRWEIGYARELASPSTELSLHEASPQAHANHSHSP